MEQTRCPVCGYPDVEAYDEHGRATFEICDCCSVEFGYQDATKSHEVLREEWMAEGMPWKSTFKKPPDGWEPLKQLEQAGLNLMPKPR